MPVTLRFQSTGTMPGSTEPIVLRGPSLTIGRGDDNDVVLPDPERMVSKHHCVVEDRGGNVVVVDLSTNGTFLNYGKIPLGDTPTTLNDGDILTIGSYELLVELPQAPAAPLGDVPPPLEDAPVSHGAAAAAGDIGDLLDAPSGDGDVLDELIGGSSRPVGPSHVQRPELGEDDDGLLPPILDDGDLDPLEPGPDPLAGQGASQPDHSPSVSDPMPSPVLVERIPEDWSDDLLAPRGAPGEGPEPIPDDPLLEGTPPEEPGVPASDEAAGPAPEATPEPVAPTPPAAAPPAAAAGATRDTAARAFLKTLGAGTLDIPDDELVTTLSRLGHVLRIMIHGTQDILRTRSSIKSEFRITQTMIAPRGNNPLKFSVSPEQAVEAMVKPSTAGYLDAPEAAAQAMDDVRAHEVAMMTGMEAALKGLLERLSPGALEDRIGKSTGIADMLKSTKARYWEAYEKMYAEISDQAENEFFELFSREFARAYQEQLERLKTK